MPTTAKSVRKDSPQRKILPIQLPNSMPTPRATTDWATDRWGIDDCQATDYRTQGVEPTTQIIHRPDRPSESISLLPGESPEDIPDIQGVLTALTAPDLSFVLNFQLRKEDPKITPHVQATQFDQRFSFQTECPLQYRKVAEAP